ncbi:DUF1679 domain-containing protein [Alteromonas sediminis]|uniref:DUF1679 domain-containing protein n=1 Tax=Alteromonas sediminis TaxID=2259342 RepID=A0A3N5ZAC5_9ALTE|nr:phosphotransferase [Alteromonas sediminis]RPJ68024.1 DUF1679 domain-containing protein [Alteromonas sediminis]
MHTQIFEEEKTLFEEAVLAQIRNGLQDSSIEFVQQIQRLWSDYGQIVRLVSRNSGKHYVAKVVSSETPGAHPRGWNTLTSHERKVRSYAIEATFYQKYAHLTSAKCLVPAYQTSTSFSGGSVLIMQDLDALGYTEKPTSPTMDGLHQAVIWLANFHATFLATKGEGLWPIGTYWHLSTRQDEWQAMPDGLVKQHAKTIDSALHNASFQTLVHGDAKVANLCFHVSGTGVAAVDFQYVGRGPGVKDLAYLLASALDNEGLYQHGDQMLDVYLNEFISALTIRQCELDRKPIEREIHMLYPVAWADYYRFLLGWNPDSWKICDYMLEMADNGLANICK